MPDTSTLAPQAPDQMHRRFRWWWPVVAVAAILVVATLPRVLATPSRVDRVTLVNHTQYAVVVDVNGGHDDGWMGLGTAERETATDVRDVIDQGDVWTFRFTSQGYDAGEVRITKADLKRSDWKVVIPAAVGERLAGQGATPTPPPGF
jgi:hypothetical protein